MDPAINDKYFKFDFFEQKLFHAFSQARVKTQLLAPIITLEAIHVHVPLDIQALTVNMVNSFFLNMIQLL